MPSAGCGGPRRVGSVLLQVEAGPETIICAPCLLADHYGEDEYLVDRRRLGRVTVFERFSEQPP
jgi:hypothetical protein